jgi:CTP-dependent riboflavin kinase
MYPQSEGDYHYNLLAEQSYKQEQEMQQEIEMLKEQLQKLQQAPCSTLRELKYKKLIERQKFIDGELKDLEQYDQVLTDLAAINRVLKLIDAQKPVA